MIVNCALYTGGLKIRDIDLSEIQEGLSGRHSFVWLGLLEPSEDLLKKVQAQFGLHDLAIEDAHRAHQRPKVEAYGDSLFIVLRTAQKVEGRAQFGETHIFIGAGYIVTVRHGASLSYMSVRNRCEGLPEQLARGPGFPLYAIMDFVVDNYLPIVQEYEDDLLRLEESIFKSSSTAEISEKIYDLKSDIMELRRGTVPLLEVCNVLLRISTPLIPPDTQLYFRDIYDHVVRINEAMDSIREMLNTALQVNLSLITVKQNDVVKKLAGWAAILGVPTMIASFYGMNFHFMPELNWEYGYPSVIGVCCTVCLYMYYRLKKADWL